MGRDGERMAYHRFCPTYECQGVLIQHMQEARRAAAMLDIVASLQSEI